MHIVKTIKPCGKTRQVCAQLNIINHFLCQIMFIRDFYFFFKFFETQQNTQLDKSFVPMSQAH